MSETSKTTSMPGADFADQVKQLRGRLGLTQVELAKKIGVSFATVNRWENDQVKPSPLYWNQLRQLEFIVEEEAAPYGKALKLEDGPLDFTATPEVVKTVAEGERLSFGHLANPTFATEISSIDPLPHQRIAVYDFMLKHPRLRFLLADDAGAGKTIMSGLYMREMLSRRLIARILVVAPAGLVGNWQREMATLFNLPFKIVSGNDARQSNPFDGDGSDRVIISIDTLASTRMFARLQENETLPYDLVIFDEAHKLTANREADMRLRKTDRYLVAEALAGVRGLDERWSLSWSAQHLLLLTATPHMGKDYPYYALWRLLEPEMLPTPEAFNEFPAAQRQLHFIRRTKEEMVKLDGSKLYPPRFSDTLGYELTQGRISEQQLYEETTLYLQRIYNKAKILNRSAARLAMSVFQRRLASSTYALMRSFERRLERLDDIIRDVQDGKITSDQLITLQSRMDECDDLFDTKTADEESALDDKEENEVAEEKILQGVIATSLSDLIAEKGQVQDLLTLARQVYDSGHESKFDRLSEILTDPKFKDEKVIVFTEHRDTLVFIVKRLGGMGFTGQIAQIHGGMHHIQRDEEVERFRKSHTAGGARFMICTDAAAEGINLQFCWIMINYDVPWNPARLEQRMGRIHRYGQKKDKVIILNLVAPATREGKVLQTLLVKLERIRKELNSDKVFDAVGRIFAGVSIKEYMEIALESGADEAARQLDGKLTKEQVEALDVRERKLFGTGGDVAVELPRLRESIEREAFCRLLPGYVRQYIQTAAPLVDVEIDGDLDCYFGVMPKRVGALDPILPALELYKPLQRQRLTVVRPADRGVGIWMHPGEPVFEKFRAMVTDRLGPQARRGAIFVDTTADKPYLFHMALLTVVRQADAEFPDLAHEEILETRIVGVKQYEGSELSLCPVEHLLLLRGGQGLPSSAQRMAANANSEKETARSFLAERVAREMALDRKRNLSASLPQRENFVERGLNFLEAELSAIRSRHAEKARSGNKKAQTALEDVRRQQRLVKARRDCTLSILRREPELIAPGAVVFVAHALCVPSSDPEDIKQHNADVERLAMDLARAFEEAAGATVLDVHTPELARAADLPVNPGFDLLSTHPMNDRRGVEVKGLARGGEIQVTDNEWARACNMRDKYWLFVAYDCATPTPRLVRVQDPFGKLLVKAFSKLQESTVTFSSVVGGVRIGMEQVMKAAETNI